MLHNNKNYLRRAKPLLGTIVDISLYSSSHDTNSLGLFMKKCFQRIQEVQNTMSYFEKSSDIFRLNHTEPMQTISITIETEKLLKLAVKLYQESQGKFDILYRGRKNNLDATIEFHDDGIVSRNSFAEVDLGGIAKGYAADEAALTAATFSDVSGVINAGGDIVFFGNKSFPLTIRSPQFDGRYLDIGYFSNCAVATSVFYQNNYPYSISVLASKCIVADSLTKALWEQDQENKEYLLNQYEARYMEINSKLNICQGAYLN